MIDWKQTLPHPLLAARASRGPSLAIVADDGEWTYESLVHAVRRRAAGLIDAGVSLGQRVAWPMRRLGDDLVTLHAIGWLGGCAVPLAPDALDPVGQAQRLGVDHWIETPQDGAATDASEPAPWPLDEVRLILETSGSTGQPKAVAITTSQLVFSAFGSAMRIGHMPGDRWLAVLPMHHVGGLSIAMRCLFAATTIELHARFDEQRVVDSLTQGRATQLSLVPTMLDRVLAGFAGCVVHSRVRTVLVGGAKPSDELIERAQAQGLPIAITWGMSETASQVATIPVGEPVGPAPPLVFLDVTSEAERLVVRGPAAAGVCVTGDRGQIDALGRVQVTGRADSIIISGGENIDPNEITQVLCQHPDVARAYVVGIPDSTYGERPGAALVAAGDRQPTAVELRAFCRQQLASFKVPDRMLWLSEEPRSETGKIRFAELKEWLSRVERTEFDGESL